MPSPPVELVYPAAIWRYARGLAYVAMGRFDKADAEPARLAEAVKSLPHARTLGGRQVAVLARIAEKVLAGEIAARRGDHGLALSLEAGRPAEAERIYREDLARHPENGWALFGLTQRLRKQNKTGEAEAVEERFKKAWARADVALPSARF